MSDQQPPELRELDTSRARKSVLLTRTGGSGEPEHGKGAEANRRRRVLGRGLLLTGLASMASWPLLGFRIGLVVFVVGIAATLARSFRAIAHPANTSGADIRVQRVQQRLDQADLPEAARLEIQEALADLAQARERELGAQREIERALATLNGPGLQTALAKAQAGGDPDEIALRRQALDSHEELVARCEERKHGYSRSEAALDALEAALAQASTPSPDADDLLEINSRKLLNQLDALKRAAGELNALEDEREQTSRRPERA